MKKPALATLGILILAAACSHSKESRQMEESPQPPAEEQSAAPVEGIVSSVDTERIAVRTGHMEEPEAFERTSRTIVLRDGQEVAWEELGEGEAVRVTYDAGIFGPDRVAQVEILSGPEAERLRSGEGMRESPTREPGGVESPMEPGSLEPRPVEPMSPPGSQSPVDDGMGF